MSTATAAEKQAYADEVKAAQEEAAAATLEPVSAEITESEWALMLQRRGQSDSDLLFDIIEEHGSVEIVPDPEPPEEAEAEAAPGEDAEPKEGNGRKKKAEASA